LSSLVNALMAATAAENCPASIPATRASSAVSGLSQAPMHHCVGYCP
jgi:hypothetical protein